MQEVVRNTRSCQKVAEQLVESPRLGTVFAQHQEKYVS